VSYTGQFVKQSNNFAVNAVKIIDNNNQSCTRYMYAKPLYGCYPIVCFGAQRRHQKDDEGKTMIWHSFIGLNRSEYCRVRNLIKTDG
jgi:hypothetical protein